MNPHDLASSFPSFLAGGLGATGISTVAYGFGEPALRLRVTRYNIQPPQWPAGFKLKIAVLADLHACDPWMSLERIGSIVERTNALKPDITVLLGDYVAGPSQGDALYSLQRMGPRAGRVACPARRACGARQS